jgi:hypothetical protein
MYLQAFLEREKVRLIVCKTGVRKACRFRNAMGLTPQPSRLKDHVLCILCVVDYKQLQHAPRGRSSCSSSIAGLQKILLMA